MPKELFDTQTHNYSARALLDSIAGYAGLGCIDIQLNSESKKRIRIAPMYGEWKDLLSVGKVSEHLQKELSVDGLDGELYFYFMVHPIPEIKHGGFTESIFYVDEKTYLLLNRRGIGGYRKMPDKVYDLAFREATQHT